MKKIISTDDNGNSLIYKQYKVGGAIRRTLSIKLKGQTREIAEVKKDKGKFYISVKRKESHIMKVNHSYGFCYNMLKECMEKNMIMIELIAYNGTFLFPIDLILNFGEFLHFKGQGFEKQIFLRLKEIEVHKV